MTVNLGITSRRVFVSCWVNRYLTRDDQTSFLAVLKKEYGSLRQLLLSPINPPRFLCCSDILPTAGRQNASRDGGSFDSIGARVFDMLVTCWSQLASQPHQNFLHPFHVSLCISRPGEERIMAAASTRLRLRSPLDGRNRSPGSPPSAGRSRV